MGKQAESRALVVELCKQFYTQGWVSGTGGGISIRDGGKIYLAPSGVQKERIAEEDLYELDADGQVLCAPSDSRLTPSACQPLFFNAYRLRNAGAVIHSHAIHAMLVTLLYRERFECTQLEMIKGIEGHGYYDKLVVPIIENTAHERDLADSMARAIEENPRSHAVLVRRHGVYIWGKDWIQAKTHAECYHYLFEAAVKMAQLGLRAESPDQAGARRSQAAPAAIVDERRVP
ncbi:MAG TPA: methylthioribulose 1-phosphate dehydratase [Polyangiales bacterium]|nr:methylthioribulose 1-phosphate dehydratase [Polyangiales bacterium]